MIVSKLFLNDNHTVNPNLSLANARNVILDDDFELLMNEKGFTKIHDLEGSICGIIPTDVQLIVCTTDGAGTDYIYRVDDNAALLSLKGNLSFSTAFPVKGEYQYNNIGDLIVCFNDTNNPLRTFNFDDPYMDINPITKEFIDEADGLNKFLLIPDYKVPIVSFDNSVESKKGTLPKGTYHVVISYYIGSHDRLNWSIPSMPVYLYKTSPDYMQLNGVTASQDFTNVGYYEHFQKKLEDNTNSSVEFTIDNIDSRYDKYKVALIYRTDTSTEVYDMGDHSTAVTYHNFGTLSESQLSLDEVTIPYINIENAADITISNDRLAMLGTKSDGIIDYQKYANNIDVKYTVIKNDVIEEDHNRYFNDIVIKTPILDEVYALNIGLVGNDGTVKGVFHIPGRAPKPAMIYDGTGNGNVSGTEDRLLYPTEQYSYNRDGIKKAGETITLDYYYQLYNTAAKGYDLDRYLAFWQNEHETYPNIDQFEVWDVDVDGNPVYKSTLVGENVRHHKMPSIDVLGHLLAETLSAENSIVLRFDNVKFPTDILNQIQGYFISYSVRDSANSTVHGYHPIIRNNFYDAPSDIYNNDNFKQIRFSDYGIMKNKPAIAKPYLRGSYTSDHNFHRVSSYYTNDNGAEISRVPDTVPWKAYNTGIRFVEDYQYLPACNSAVTPTNRGREETLMLDINYPWDDSDDSLVCALKSDLEDVFKPFYNQKIAIASNVILTTPGIFEYTNDDVNGFDGFLCMTRDLVYHGDQTLIVDDDGIIDRDNDSGDKSQVLSAIGCISISTVNTHVRDRDEGILQDGNEPIQILGSPGIRPESLYYTGNIVSDPSEGFGFDYRLSYSYINSIVGYYTYDYNNVFVDDHPYRVTRSAVQAKESLVLNWRYFAALEYYEMPKHRGVGVAITGQDNLLLIHMEHSLYVAQAKDKISVPDGDAFIGTSDIFDREPDEFLPSSSGTAGVQSRFGNVVGKLGYVFYDSYEQATYVYTNKGYSVITDNQIRKFVKKHFNNASTGNPLTGADLIFGIDEAHDRLIITNKGTTSFTLSYCFNNEVKSFIAMHDYIPSLMVHNRIGLYSTGSNLTGIYKHNVGDFGTYYGTKNESYVDILVNEHPKTGKILNAIAMQSGVYDDANNIDKVFFYNKNQCSKVYDIVETTTIEDFDTARFIEEYWQYDMIRDFSSDAIVQSIVDDFGTINTAAINLGKAWHDLGDIHGKYFIVRLIVNNSKEVRFRNLAYSVSANRR